MPQKCRNSVPQPPFSSPLLYRLAYAFLPHTPSLPCTVTQLIYAKMLGRLMTLCSKRRQRSAAVLQWVKGAGRRGERGEKGPAVSMGMARKTFWHAVSLLLPRWREGSRACSWVSLVGLVSSARWLTGWMAGWLDGCLCCQGKKCKTCAKNDKYA